MVLPFPAFFPPFRPESLGFRSTVPSDHWRFLEFFTFLFTFFNRLSNFALISMSPVVIVVGGPAGTGKTTIAQLLSTHYKCPFIEGDELHPPANIQKMEHGIPLTDDDRWGWLAKIASHLEMKACDQGNTTGMCVVLCSMLKKSYRDYIKAHTQSGELVTFRFIFLCLTFAELVSRVNGRAGHYMKSDMVRLQYDIMQVPEGTELVSNGGEAVAVDTTSKTPSEILEVVLAEIAL